MFLFVCFASKLYHFELLVLDRFCWDFCLTVVWFIF
ncbi:unnamed protein product [Brassica oleracea]